MIDMAAISGGLASLKAATEIAGGLVNLRDTTKFQAAVVELQSKILTAQSNQFALLERVKEPEARLAELQTWDEQKKRYQLKDFGGNTFAYELKPDAAHGEPGHRICPACYERGQRSILQFDFRTSVGQDRYICQGCKTQFEFGVRQRSERLSPMR